MLDILAGLLIFKNAIVLATYLLVVESVVTGQPSTKERCTSPVAILEEMFSE
jgi:hypothetical protein